MSDVEITKVQRIVEAQLRADVFLRGFLDRDPQKKMLLSQQIRPREEDWNTVFVEDAMDAFRRYYEPFLTGNIVPAGKVNQTELKLSAAQAEHLVYKNPLSRRFPGGYKKVAHLFQPQTIWLAWKYTEPGRTVGMAYDGLVFLPDDRFVWFPKPWRAIQ